MTYQRRRLIVSLLLLPLAVLCLASLAIVDLGLNDDLHAADLGVVLGSKVNTEKFGVAPVYTSRATFWSVRDFYSVPHEAVGYLVYALRKPDDIDTAAVKD